MNARDADLLKNSIEFNLSRLKTIQDLPVYEQVCMNLKSFTEGPFALWLVNFLGNDVSYYWDASNIILELGHLRNAAGSWLRA